MPVFWWQPHNNADLFLSDATPSVSQVALGHHVLASNMWSVVTMAREKRSG